MKFQACAGFVEGTFVLSLIKYEKIACMSLLRNTLSTHPWCNEDTVCFKAGQALLMVYPNLRHRPCSVSKDSERQDHISKLNELSQEDGKFLCHGGAEEREGEKATVGRNEQGIGEREDGRGPFHWRMLGCLATCEICSNFRFVFYFLSWWDCQSFSEEWRGFENRRWSDGCCIEYRTTVT